MRPRGKILNLCIKRCFVVKKLGSDQSELLLQQLYYQLEIISHNIISKATHFLNDLSTMIPPFANEYEFVDKDVHHHQIARRLCKVHEFFNMLRKGVILERDPSFFNMGANIL